MECTNVWNLESSMESRNLQGSQKQCTKIDKEATCIPFANNMHLVFKFTSAIFEDFSSLS